MQFLLDFRSSRCRRDGHCSHVGHAADTILLTCSPSSNNSSAGQNPSRNYRSTKGVFELFGGKRQPSKEVDDIAKNITGGGQSKEVLQELKRVRNKESHRALSCDSVVCGLRFCT